MIRAYFTGYFTRQQGAVARACSVLVAVLLAGGALTSLIGFNVGRLLVSAAGAWAFAANTQASIGRTRRMLAILVQVANLLQFVGLVVLLLLLADSGQRGWRDIPWWASALILSAFTVLGIGAADGVRAYSEEA